MVGRTEARQFFAQVSLFRWHISQSMLLGRVSRQEHGIEKVHPPGDRGLFPCILSCCRESLGTFSDCLPLFLLQNVAESPVAKRTGDGSAIRCFFFAVVLFTFLRMCLFPDGRMKLPVSYYDTSNNNYYPLSYRYRPSNLVRTCPLRTHRYKSGSNQLLVSVVPKQYNIMYQ